MSKKDATTQADTVEQVIVRVPIQFEGALVKYSTNALVNRLNSFLAVPGNRMQGRDLHFSIEYEGVSQQCFVVREVFKKE